VGELKWFKYTPKLGDKKVVEKFLLWPRSIYKNHVEEKRWLEKVRLHYVYVEIDFITDTYNDWELVRFEDIK